VSSPRNSARNIADCQPGAAQHHHPTADREGYAEKHASCTGKPMVLFGDSDWLFHPPTQICAQAAGRRIGRTDRKERGAERPASVILSAPRIDLIRRAFHSIWCKCISAREQAAFNLGLILSRSAIPSQCAAPQLRRLLHSSRWMELKSLGNPSFCTASFVQGGHDRPCHAAGAAVPGVPR
jgi:hypothetical protein